MKSGVEMKFIGKSLLIENGKRILVIGDLHLGYEEALGRSDIMVGRKMFRECLEELDKIFKETGKVDEVVLLGDVKHVFGSIIKQDWNDVLELFDYLENKCKKIIVVKGKHDAILEPIVNRKGNVVLENNYVSGNFCFFHGDKKYPGCENGGIKYWIMGHWHPAVEIGDGAKVEKYKCFLIGKFENRKVILVPSFAIYNEGSDPRENYLERDWNFDLGKFDVKIVSEELEVLDFGKLEDL